ncbi:Crp/Fnr family transcriptional regulator [Halomonas sp. ATCH28]|uniref:Crp/Fnr family transcriptional regulator n=1 Tax=Halomonas gemina TaxID=2945105 RepID=A0ABT0SWV9_9GAMM|nr:Crp/Fnr family transcriptional regulator [Halomonas gemina]MCL7939087.1 Crp/Fnr family transcriptional regulator [Halomonas gemina]
MSPFRASFGRYLDLSEHDETLLARYERQARSAERNQLLWRPGDKVDDLFILQHGWACTIRSSKDGDRQIIDLLLPGEIIGIQEFTFRRHITEARMVTPGLIQPFPHESIVDIVEASTPLAITLFAKISCQEALLAERLLVTLHRSARSQVLHFIVETFLRLEKVQHVDLASFEFPISQRLLGDILGLSPVHINRTLKALEHDRVLKKHRDRIEVYDPTRLFEEADFDAEYLIDERDGLKTLLAQR